MRVERDDGFAFDVQWKTVRILPVVRAARRTWNDRVGYEILADHPGHAAMREGGAQARARESRAPTGPGRWASSPSARRQRRAPGTPW